MFRVEKAQHSLTILGNLEFKVGLPRPFQSPGAINAKVKQYLQICGGGGGCVLAGSFLIYRISIEL